MNKALAEFIGTFTLVLFGCGAAVIAGPAVGATTVGVLGIAFAFGLAIVAMAYGIGSISGCHVNPAVSLGVLLAGKMSAGDFVTYVIAQCLGAIAGTAVLYLIMSGKGAGWDGGLGANGWGEGYMGGYDTLSAFVFEAVATFIFLIAILGVTRPGTPTHIAGFAGLAIGLTLVLIHIVGINVTGVSVNPARSLGPALFTGGNALAQLWLFIVAPLVGAAIAGLLSRSGALWPGR
jgi:aquaporin Z